MIQHSQNNSGYRLSIPRESGDDPFLRTYGATVLQYSPRERG